MGTNLSQCAGSLTKQEYEIRADVTGISSDNATIDSIRTIRADSYRYESDTANSHHTPEYRMRSDSIESESSIILLNSMNTSELDTGTAVVQLLHYCESGNGASVRLLLSHCDALNEVLNDYHMCHVGDREMNITPLMLAAACGHPHIVHTLLISQNILANAISNDSYGQTALHIAVSLGQLMCVQVLVASMKVDVNSRDNLEMTPLHVATFGHFDEAIRLLLEREDINCGLQDANGNSVLHIGAINGDPSALKSIIQHASMIDFNNICCYGNQPSIRGTSSIQRPSLGGSLQLLVDVSSAEEYLCFIHSYTHLIDSRTCHLHVAPYTKRDRLIFRSYQI